MTYEAKITIKYDSTWDRKGGIYDDEMIPEEHITFECPAHDLNTTQLFKFFEKFALAMGYNETTICDGACRTVVNCWRWLARRVAVVGSCGCADHGAPLVPAARTAARACQRI